MKTKLKIIFFSLIIFFGLNISTDIKAAQSPVILFSDLTDAPVSGWEGSATKGAAVSVWGLNLSATRGTSYITVGGVNLTSDSDYAEWGATTNPTTSRGLQRITFWLNSSMSLGETTISVTTADGTSETIPFYTRNTGNIYFVSTVGDDSNDGLTTLTPFKTLYKMLPIMAAGDVFYLRAGAYLETDPSSPVGSECLINMSNGNHAAGVINNSISIASYPGELAILGDGTLTHNSILRQASYTPTDHMDYFIWSKIKWQASNAVWAIDNGGATGGTINNVRLVGNDATTTQSSIGKGIAFQIPANAGSENFKMLGNYIHHTGKSLNWVPSDGSGYRVGPLYFSGFGIHSGITEVAWNEFAYNNGQSQFYGHHATDKIALLKYHDNLIHHTSTQPTDVIAVSAVFGGGDSNDTPQSNYAFITEGYIYNNVFYANGGGIRAGDTTSWGGHGGSLYFFNNSFYGNTDYTQREISVGNLDAFVYRNNIVWTTAGSGDYFYGPTDMNDISVGSNNIYYGLSNSIPIWDDTVSSVSNTNPLYTNPSANDFTLQSTSPAINAGATLAFVPKDFLGTSRPQGSAYDIGAFEYVSAAEETCSDNIQNQDETGIDCGGVCEACIVPTTYGLSSFISAITNWLGIGNETSDVNSDGVVNTRDLGVMMSNWGE